MAVHDVHAVAVAGAYCHVGVGFKGGAQAGQVGGIVAEIGVHLVDALISAAEHAVEAGQVGCAQALLALAAEQVDAAGASLHHAAHERGRAVGRVVVDDEHVEVAVEGEHRVDDGLDVLLLIICRYNHHVAVGRAV